jgi:hypothetical protein
MGKRRALVNGAGSVGDCHGAGRRDCLFAIGFEIKLIEICKIVGLFVFRWRLLDMYRDIKVSVYR